ncbi:hypothetical protein [Spirosoma oryzae]|uniref:hypothetical protein n=1 Tax=Spirosoma oryzae TaxID=1469603 RepID=UPI00147600ED|nr:hypothetical protein [Spirosoma oryzae]
MTTDYATPKLLAVYVTVRRRRANRPIRRACEYGRLNLHLPSLIGHRVCVDLTTYIG